MLTGVTLVTTLANFFLNLEVYSLQEYSAYSSTESSNTQLGDHGLGELRTVAVDQEIPLLRQPFLGQALPGEILFGGRVGAYLALDDERHREVSGDRPCRVLQPVKHRDAERTLPAALCLQCLAPKL